MKKSRFTDEQVAYAPRRIAPLRRIASVPRRGDLQYPADRLDPLRVAVLVDEGPHGCFL